jgi:hypothetical protein
MAMLRNATKTRKLADSQVIQLATAQNTFRKNGETVGSEERSHACAIRITDDGVGHDTKGDGDEHEGIKGAMDGDRYYRISRRSAIDAPPRRADVQSADTEGC